MLPLPKRSHTKILADPGNDGQYIRNQISLSKPEMWKRLSRELFKKGYMFPEMLEYTDHTEFPTNFVDPLSW